MCGRTACTLAPDELCKACQENGLPVSWHDHPGMQHTYFPSYNVAPTAHTPVIFSGKLLKTLANEIPETELVIQPMMWNLIPHFYKGETPQSHGYKTNNCRVETVQEKPMFSHLWKNGQRCVVLCDGFYEWQTKTCEKSKQPYFIYACQPKHLKIWDRSSWEDTKKDFSSPALLKMAGLFSKWKSVKGEEVWSYAVLTTEAQDDFNWLHHRVPLILDTAAQVKLWLDPDNASSEVLSAFPRPPALQWHRVSPAVNNSRHNSKDCVRPAEDIKRPASSSSRLMTAWLSKANKPATVGCSGIGNHPAATAASSKRKALLNEDDDDEQDWKRKPMREKE